VTVDCGWTLPDRIANGTLTWNPAIFPSGYFALGNFIHGLGLGFGVYQDAGIQTCMTGSPTQVGSLCMNPDIFLEQQNADLIQFMNASTRRHLLHGEQIC
jgi:hypothetical protein